jgi:hypothetical protein
MVGERRKDGADHVSLTSTWLEDRRKLTNGPTVGKRKSRNLLSRVERRRVSLM